MKDFRIRTTGPLRFAIVFHRIKAKEMRKIGDAGMQEAKEVRVIHSWPCICRGGRSQWTKPFNPAASIQSVKVRCAGDHA
eukprot:240698-Pelagomonas_calceolata.AAC.2